MNKISASRSYFTDRAPRQGGIGIKFRYCKRIFIWIAVFSTIFAARSFGQEQKKDALSQLHQVQKYFKTKDPLKETLDEVGKGYKTDIPGREAETIALLRSLKDPFMPQLPKPALEEETEPEGEGPKTGLPPVKEETRPALPIIEKPRLEISGLIWNTDRPQAIVNGQIVAVGDTLDNWTIVGITREGVEVTSQNTTFMIEPFKGGGL